MPGSLANLTADGATYALRRATSADVRAIVELIAADQIGATRDGGDLAPYERAFAAIDADPAQLLLPGRSTRRAGAAARSSSSRATSAARRRTACTGGSASPR